MVGRMKLTYQMNEAHVKLDEEGQFYGSDVASGDRLIFSGQYSGNDQVAR